MKKIISLLSVMLFAVSLIAQEPPKDPETRAKDHTKKMKDLIEFSDEQEAKIYNLNLDIIKKRREAFQNRTEDREQMREKMRELQSGYDKELKSILDEKQYAKYLEEKENLRMGGGRNRTNRPSGQGGQNQ